MMRNLYLSATIVFWLAVFAFWVGSAYAPNARETTPAKPDRVISLSELARHGSPTDCWMAIRGNVYDVTAYLPEHPSRPQIIEPWCGKEATEAYDTKTRGRPHSKAADDLLAGYRIGKLEKTGP